MACITKAPQKIQIHLFRRRPAAIFALRKLPGAVCRRRMGRRIFLERWSSQTPAHDGPNRKGKRRRKCRGLDSFSTTQPKSMARSPLFVTRSLKNGPLIGRAGTTPRQRLSENAGIWRERAAREQQLHRGLLCTLKSHSRAPQPYHHHVHGQAGWPAAAMASTIHVHVGQCGNQLGERFWSLAAENNSSAGGDGRMGEGEQQEGLLGGE